MRERPSRTFWDRRQIGAGGYGISRTALLDSSGQVTGVQYGVSPEIRTLKTWGQCRIRLISRGSVGSTYYSGNKDAITINSDGSATYYQMPCIAAMAPSLALGLH